MSKYAFVKEKWAQIRNVFVNASEKCLTELKTSNKKQWFHDESKNILQLRNEAKTKLLNNNTKESKREYDLVKKESRQICRRKQRQLWEDILDDIEYNFRNKEIRNFYEEVKESRSLYSADTTYYRNKNGRKIKYLGRVSRKTSRKE
ncbi:hypothetical protein ILUMI_23250 [Ignelater luminosus]|uniref:Uncharacterized protein n=1 Tax=Ignelater luminosus TaxID=2038154 RepID=A0A8K0FX07_IGNLU|nr:hypothetical protein ILUMI_23250 [Ignelater luminosus]